MNVLRTILCLFAAAAALAAQWGGELRFCLRSEPRSLHPALVDDEAGETIRYLTGGFLVRVNRATQQLEPELASSWKVSQGGRAVSFRIRDGLTFSDGTPFSAGDVAYTMDVLMDPALHSPTADAFRSGAGRVRSTVSGSSVTIVFPEPVAAGPRLFDQVAILSRRSPHKELAVLGPFRLAEHKPGAFFRLERNPYYWKSENGRRLPYLDAIRLDIQPNREIELLRFRRGELDLITGLSADHYEQLLKERPEWVRDAGPSLENEFLWFNLSGVALPSYKTAWFRSREFRLAVSHAIRRDDLCRLAYRGHAVPGSGPFPPANRLWFNARLRPHAYDLGEARRLLAAAGFRREGTVLKDRDGRPVEFSLVTSAGNKGRERMAALIEQDLAALGIRLRLVPLDFPSLLERISKTMDYEACLLGLINVDPDPNGQMNIWLSSGANHPWNPREPQPATPWEAEIDRLMQAQSAAPDPARRKALFDRVQEIVMDQAPVLYLAYHNALVGISPAVKNSQPVMLRPQAVWNVDRLYLAANR